MPVALAVYSLAHLPHAKQRLRSLAEAGRSPRVLEILNHLKDELIACHQADINPSTILLNLQQAGYPIPRPSFYPAWHQFTRENGLVRAKHTPRLKPVPIGAVRQAPTGRSKRAVSSGKEDPMEILSR